MLEPIVDRLLERDYKVIWDDFRDSGQLGRADITWVSALQPNDRYLPALAELSRAGGTVGEHLVGYYLGDWTNLAEGRRALRQIYWPGFDLVFHANPVLVEELRRLCPETRRIRFVYLPRAIDSRCQDRGRSEFRRRIGMWGYYGRWWKDAWWLIRAFGKLKDMASREGWELEFWGCPERLMEGIPEIAIQEAQKMGVKLHPWADSFDELLEWIYSLDMVAHSSLSEGDAKPIAEGMLTGCYPLIRNWPGARALYPDKYIVENEWVFVQKAMEWAAKSDADKTKLAEESAAFARNKHDLKAIVDTVDWEFRKLTR